ncbi:MAG: hypothetical protein P1U85_21195 [Verrucomicrobiales bacterium]|nr:hypothetical protein [Verrucomicrobiales bacterium]
MEYENYMESSSSFSDEIRSRVNDVKAQGQQAADLINSGRQSVGTGLESASGTLIVASKIGNKIFNVNQKASIGVQNIKNYFKLRGQGQASGGQGQATEQASGQASEQVDTDISGERGTELIYFASAPEQTPEQASGEGEQAGLEDINSIQSKADLKSVNARVKSRFNELSENEQNEVMDAGKSSSLFKESPQTLDDYKNNLSIIQNEVSNKIPNQSSEEVSDVANVAEDTTDSVAETLGTVASVDEGLETAGAVLDSTGIGAVVGVGLEIAGVIGTAISGLVDLFEPKEQPKPVIPDTSMYSLPSFQAGLN